MKYLNWISTTFTQQAYTQRLTNLTTQSGQLTFSIRFNPTTELLEYLTLQKNLWMKISNRKPNPLLAPSSEFRHVNLRRLWSQPSVKLWPIAWIPKNLNGPGDQTIRAWSRGGGIIISIDQFPPTAKAVHDDILMCEVIIHSKNLVPVRLNPTTYLVQGSRMNLINGNVFVNIDIVGIERLGDRDDFGGLFDFVGDTATSVILVRGRE